MAIQITNMNITYLSKVVSIETGRWIVAVSGKYQLLGTANVRKLKWTLRYWLAIAMRESHILHEIANWKLLRFHFVRYDFDSCQPTVMKMFFFWIEFIAVSHRFSLFARFFAWFSTANTLRNLPIRYLCEIAICKVHVFQFCKSIIGGHQMNGLFILFI